LEGKDSGKGEPGAASRDHLRGPQAWRLDLRTGAFLDELPDPSDVPDEVVSYVKHEANWTLLCAEWDRKYPTNPVSRSEDVEQG
jgi:hypothetical protein